MWFRRYAQKPWKHLALSAVEEGVAITYRPQGCIPCGIMRFHGYAHADLRNSQANHHIWHEFYVKLTYSDVEISEIHGLARVLCDSGAMLKTLVFLRNITVLSIYISTWPARGCISDEHEPVPTAPMWNCHVLNGNCDAVLCFGVKLVKLHGPACVWHDLGTMLKTLLFYRNINVLSIYITAWPTRVAFWWKRTGLHNFEVNPHDLVGFYVKIAQFDVKLSGNHAKCVFYVIPGRCQPMLRIIVFP